MYNEPQESLKTKITSILSCVFAALIMALNIQLLVKQAGLFPGGATGLTVLIQQSFDQFLNIQLPYTVINLLINSIPIYIGVRFIGKRFTVMSILMILLTDIFADIIPSRPLITEPILSCIFGGMVNGFAISTCLRNNFTSGGTDFIAIYFSEKLNKDSFNLVFGINVVILSTAGLLFGWEKALYSIIFQYMSTQVIHLLYRKYQKETMFIVTDHPQEVCEVISRITNHGATVMKGEGAYLHEDRSMIYSVVARSEYKQVIHAIREIDPKCFINSVASDEVDGRFYIAPNR